MLKQRHVLLPEDAVVDTLRLNTDADAQCVSLLVIGACALVDSQCTAAVTEGVAVDTGLGIDRGIDYGAQSLANLCGRTGSMANGEGPGVNLLLLIASSLVD